MLKKWEKYKDKGYTGLTNLGNTCFLNSCMQALNHTYELHDILDSETIISHMKPDLPDTHMIKEWNELRDIIWKNDGIITPNKFVNNVHRVATIKNREIFTGWSQNDMPEFLLFMIEAFHNSISRPVSIKITGKSENETDKLAVKCYEMLQQIYKKEYSEIMDLFYGIYVSEIRSLDTNTTHSLRPEHFFVLDLPIPGHLSKVTLHDCFDEYVKPEILRGENAWYNETTHQREDIQKRIVFWNLPKVLIITLKRVSHDGRYKSHQLVECPLDNLDLSRYVYGYSRSQYKYELYAVCNHMGNAFMGHYSAFVKNAKREWIHYNDQNVTKIGQEPQNDGEEKSKFYSQIVTPVAYCLFYRKKNTEV